MRTRLAAVIVVATVALAGCSFSVTSSKEHDNCTVQIKQSKQAITTCGGFSVPDKADYNRLRVGRTYDIKSSGTKNGLPKVISVNLT